MTKNDDRKTIDEQITEFFKRGGKIEKLEQAATGRINGLTKKESRDTQKRKLK
jgi:hypothetical protein